MKLQTLLQPTHSACPSVLSDDTGYCFVPGVPLSIHTYSTANSVLLSTFNLPTSSDTTRLINIHKHPQFPNEQLILIASDGAIFIYDFLKSCLLATYHTRFTLLFSSIRNPSSHPSTNQNQAHQSSTLTLFVVTKKNVEVTAVTPTVKPSKRRTANGPSTDPRSKKTRTISILYAIRLNPPTDEGKSTIGTPEGKIQVIQVVKTSKATCYSASACGNWVGIVTGMSIWVIRFLRFNLFEAFNRPRETKETGYQVVHLQACESITTIAFPPETHADYFSNVEASSTVRSCTPCDFFATGSVTGRIALWHALSETQWATFVKQAVQSPSAILPCPTSVSHWHAHAVADLVFTQNGSYLLSGGEESVLVSWKLDDFDGIGQDSKSFLARLKSPIIKLSLIDRLPSHEPGVLVNSKDGHLFLVSTASMTVVKPLCLPKMYQLPSFDKRQTCLMKGLSSPIGTQPDSSRPYLNIILPSSYPTTLQVLDGGSGDRLNEIYVTPKNTVSRRDERPIVEPQLKHMALSGRGDHYMATINTWHDVDHGFEPETTLKLWERHPDRPDDFELVARVDNPHDGKITSLNISTSPAGIPTIVTTSLDGVIKLWSSSNLDSRPRPKGSRLTSIEWLKSTCLSHRDLKALDSAFSEDGTVMAVVHPQCVSIWDILHHRLLKTIGSGSMNRLGDFKQVQFVGATMNKFMILGSRALGIFELTTSKEIGFWNSEIDLVVQIPHSDHIIVFEKKVIRRNKTEGAGSSKHTQQNMLTVIDICSSTQVISMKVRSTRAAAFVNRSSPPISDHRPTKQELLDGLVLLTDGGGLLRFGEDVLAKYAAAAAARALTLNHKTQTILPFQELLTDTNQSELESFNTEFVVSNTVNTDLASMFNTILQMPPHLIPPSRMIWSTLLVPNPPSGPSRPSLDGPSDKLQVTSTNGVLVDEEAKEELGLEPLPVGSTFNLSHIPLPSFGMRAVTVKELQSQPYLTD